MKSLTLGVRSNVPRVRPPPTFAGPRSLTDIAGAITCHGPVNGTGEGLLDFIVGPDT